jgi:hypothetical protein
MDEALLSTDPVVPAAAALAAVRHLRRLCISGRARHALVVHCPGVLSRTHRVLDKAGDGELFCDAALDDLHDCISLVERVVASGTKVGYETYDAWDDRGETTILHRVEKLTPEASAASVLLAELNRLASLIARTLDLMEARAIIHGSRPADTAAPPRRGPAVRPESLTSPADPAGS